LIQIIRLATASTSVLPYVIVQCCTDESHYSITHISVTQQVQQWNVI